MERKGKIGEADILGITMQIAWKFMPGKYGLMSLADQTIFISPKCTDWMLKRTLLHEIYHTCSYLGGLAFVTDSDEGSANCVENLAPLILWNDNAVRFENRELKKLFA